jgi:hypothetical protein
VHRPAQPFIANRELVEASGGGIRPFGGGRPFARARARTLPPWAADYRIQT